jgi:DNA-binding response OmpR family regulator
MSLLPPRALIADPDTVWRERTRAALVERGFACEVAEDGEQARQMLDAIAFDLLVTELALPRKHGHALVVETLAHRPSPRVVILSHLSDARLVRDLLSRGVDDYLHKSIPTDLLGTKMQALFELDRWRASQAAAQGGEAPVQHQTSLEAIEHQLWMVSEYYARAMAPLFEQEVMIPELPRGIRDFIIRLSADERAAAQASMVQVANTRSTPRVEVLATAIALEVDDRMHPVAEPVKLMIRDISTTGVKMLHTRALPAGDLVLSWPAETISGYTLRLPLCVTRCRPIGRFYDIGGQFDIPPAVIEASRKAVEEATAVTS